MGGVAIGAGTLALLPDAVTEPLGALELKGKAEPVEAHVLHRWPACGRRRGGEAARR